MAPKDLLFQNLSVFDVFLISRTVGRLSSDPSGGRRRRAAHSQISPAGTLSAGSRILISGHKSVLLDPIAAWKETLENTTIAQGVPVLGQIQLLAHLTHTRALS